MIIKWLLVYVTVIGTDAIANDLAVYATRTECVQEARRVEDMTGYGRYDRHIVCMKIEVSGALESRK